MIVKIITKTTETFKSLGYFSALLILPLVFLIIYATCKRYFWGNMPSWGYEIPIFLYGIFFLIGGILCQINDKHVNVDILPKYVSVKTHNKLMIFSNLVIVASCLMVAYHASSWAYESTLLNERSVHQTDFNPSIWWFKWFVPISFFGVAVQATVNTLSILTRDSSKARN